MSLNAMLEGMVQRFFQKEFADLRAKHDELDRRLNNLFREAKVTKLHADEGMAEVDADGLPSTKIPWLARAGQSREWDPPTEGERVILISPTGDPGIGMILPGGFSNQFPQNHDKGGEHRRSVGDKVSTTTTDKDKVTKTEKVTVAQNADNHLVDAGAKHLVAAASVLSEAAGVKHLVDQAKILADAPLFRAVKKVILASG